MTLLMENMKYTVELIGLLRCQIILQNTFCNFFGIVVSVLTYQRPVEAVI